MGVNGISAEMLMASYFSQGMLAAYCTHRIGKSDKGGTATLAERIAREWAKPTFEPLPAPAGLKKRSQEAAADGGGEEEAAAKRKSALDEIKAKRARQAEQAAARASAQAKAADTAAPAKYAAAAAEPWLPAVLEDAQGGKVATSKALAGKVVALYFSAHWCPPCREFTPKLAAAYEMVAEDDVPFEVIFVSSDDSADAAAEYMEAMHGTWLRVPFDCPQRNALKRRFGCFGAKEHPDWPDTPRRSGIPALVIVDHKGTELVFNANDVLTPSQIISWVENDKFDGLHETAWQQLSPNPASSSVMQASIVVHRPPLTASQLTAHRHGQIGFSCLVGRPRCVECLQSDPLRSTTDEPPTSHRSQPKVEAQAQAWAMRRLIGRSISIEL
eukprot:CAMPEP_0115884516 /NCGR_PEP_ID=MMETSP0287-20121206/30161_1 /TAXON_ID=412157 /ORGANISM="Chrysochromulina rotalis, Strain UIO044" /LENGTH=385 /DNA_ID=CAMNT_0003340829 /DNA_START=1 /DNA_END=1155 /DNA_ORIENTATION=-